MDNASSSTQGRIAGLRRVFEHPVLKRFLPLEVVLLVALAFGIYFTRLDALPCSLDEPLWATISQGMVSTGDWIVPRPYGILIPDRPPAQCWLIAGSMLMLGDADMTAPRFPSAMATLLTSLLIYALARTFLSRQSALASGAAYLTMIQVWTKGTTADTDAVFTFFVTASLFLWILGYVRKWPSPAIWALGYFFAAMASLCKGAQGVCFFAAPVVVFLFLRRDWRFLFSRSHAFGLAVFLVVFCGWLVPFWLKTDSQSVKAVFTGVVEERFANTGIGGFFKHLAVYPLNILEAMLPWSPWLLFYIRRDFRRSLAAAPVQIHFLIVAIAVCFLPVWLPPGSHARYFMPLFPCFAPLLGIVFERVSSSTGSMRKWLQFAGGGVVLAMGAIILLASLAKADSRLAQPEWFAACFFLAALAVSAALFHAGRKPRGRCAQYLVLIVSAFAGLCLTGVATNQYTRDKVDIKSSVAAAKKLLPPGAGLVTLGYLHPVFVYYFARPIGISAWPKRASDLPPGTSYFCFNADQHPDAKLPFAWTKIAEVRCDRGLQTPSTRTVIIGRLLHD